MQFSTDKKMREWEYLETFIVKTIIQGLQGINFSLSDLATFMNSIEAGVLQMLTQLANVDKNGIEKYYESKAANTAMIDKCKKEVIKRMEN